MGLLENFLLAKRIIASNFNINKYPYKFTFALTYNCNSRCSICNIWKMKSKNELILEEIDLFFKNNPYFLWIDLTGGEIFLRPDLLKIIKVIKERCNTLHTLHFPTNGLMSDHIINTVKKITKLNLNKLIISVSIDGPPEIHDKIRGVKGAFKKAIETYRKLREMDGVEVYAGMTLSKDNVDFLDETIASIKSIIPDFSYRDLHINVAHSSSHYYGIQLEENSVEKTISVITHFMRCKGISILDPASILEFQYLRGVKDFLEKQKCPMSCHSLSVSLFMDPYGTVYPCTIYDRNVGNIRRNDLKDILASPETKNLARNIRKLNCPQCWTPCEAYQTILANMLKIKTRVFPFRAKS